MVYILVEGKEDVHFIGYLLSKKLKIGKEITLESGVIESDLYKIEWNFDCDAIKPLVNFLTEHIKPNK